MSILFYRDVSFCILIDKEPPSPSSEGHCAYLVPVLSLPDLIRVEVEENRNVFTGIYKIMFSPATTF
jgi:hypothetical protein